MITKVKSSTGTGEYIVDTMELNCTCPHFLYRLMGTGQLCKHITEVLNNPNKYKKKGITIVDNSKDLLDFIKTHENDAVLFVERYSEEKFDKLKSTGQVFEKHGKLTVLK